MNTTNFRDFVRRLMGLTTIFAVCTVTAATGLSTSRPDTYKERFISQVFGQDRGSGSLIGIQPFMEPADYRSEQSFLRKLDSYMAAANAKGWLNKKSIVAFPEVIGFYLVAAGERAEVYNARSLEEAGGLMLSDTGAPLSNVGMREMPTDPVLKARRILIAAKAPEMTRVYQAVFSKLARKYGVTIAAGSTFLPSPTVQHGRLLCDQAGTLRNVSAVFGTDGNIYPELVLKAFPPKGEVERLGIKRGEPDAIPVFQTPAGRLGVAICADSWFPQTYEALNKRGAEIIVTCSQYGDARYMAQPWHGYSLCPGAVAPGDVDPDDIERVTEGEAWLKYAMPGRMGRSALRVSKAKYGLTVFTRGKFWEETSVGGPPFVMRDGVLLSSVKTHAVPSLICLWLD